MESKSVGKYIGVSVRKARVPADIVRGMNAVEAMNILKYMRKGAALPVRKVIESAIANAIHNYGMNSTTLFVSEIMVGQGPVQRRIYYKGKGGYRFFNRPTSHITVILRDRTAGEEKKVEKNKAEKVSKKVKAVKEVKSEKSAKPVVKTKKASVKATSKK